MEQPKTNDDAFDANQYPVLLQEKQQQINELKSRIYELTYELENFQKNKQNHDDLQTQIEILSNELKESFEDNRTLNEKISKKNNVTHLTSMLCFSFHLCLCVFIHFLQICLGN